MRTQVRCIEVRVRVRGAEASAVLDAAYRAGVAMRGLAIGPDELAAWVRATDLERLRPVLRALGARARFSARRGLGPWVLAPLGRPVLLLGALILAVGYVLLASRVWWVSVAEGPRVPVAQVLRATRALGLKPGVPKGAIDPLRLERELVARFPAFSWVGVRVDGVRVRLFVMVRAPEPELASASLQPLRAAATGIVTRIEVHQGTAAVAVGDTVVRGQVLIRAERGGEPARAAGVVLGRTFHQVRVFEPFVVQERRPGARVTRVTVVRIDGQPVILGTPPPGSSRLGHRVVWRNPLLPVEIERDTYTRSRRVKIRRTLAQVRWAARRAARARLVAELPRSYRLVDERTRFATTAQGVELTVTTDSEQDLTQGAASTPKRG